MPAAVSFGQSMCHGAPDCFQSLAGSECLTLASFYARLTIAEVSL